MTGTEITVTIVVDGGAPKRVERYADESLSEFRKRVDSAIQRLDEKAREEEAARRRGKQ